MLALVFSACAARVSALEEESLVGWYYLEVARLKAKAPKAYLALDPFHNCTELDFQSKIQLQEARKNYDLQMAFQGPTGQYHRPTWRKEAAILKRSYDQEVRSVLRPFCAGNVPFDIEQEHEHAIALLTHRVLASDPDEIDTADQGALLAKAVFESRTLSAESVAADTERLIERMRSLLQEARTIEASGWLGNIRTKFNACPEEVDTTMRSQRARLQRDFQHHLKAVKNEPSRSGIKKLAGASVRLDALDVQQLLALLKKIMDDSGPLLVALIKVDHRVSALHKRAHWAMKPLYKMGNHEQDQADRLNDDSSETKDFTLGLTDSMKDDLESQASTILERAEDLLKDAERSRTKSVISLFDAESNQVKTSQVSSEMEQQISTSSLRRAMQSMAVVLAFAFVAVGFIRARKFRGTRDPLLLPVTELDERSLG